MAGGDGVHRVYRGMAGVSVVHNTGLKGLVGMEDYGFKFKIGQAVQMVDGDPIASHYGKQKLVVVDRVLYQGYSGTQRHYYVRAFGLDGAFAKELVRVCEIELEPRVEPSIDKTE